MSSGQLYFYNLRKAFREGYINVGAGSKKETRSSRMRILGICVIGRDREVSFMKALRTSGVPAKIRLLTHSGDHDREAN